MNEYPVTFKVTYYITKYTRSAVDIRDVYLNPNVRFKGYQKKVYSPLYVYGFVLKDINLDKKGYRSYYYHPKS